MQTFHSFRCFSILIGDNKIAGETFPFNYYYPFSNYLAFRLLFFSFLLSFVFSSIFFPLFFHFQRRRNDSENRRDLKARSLMLVIVDNISEAALYPSSNYIGAAAPAELGE